MTLEVPFNTKAKLILTPSEIASLKVNGKDFKVFQNDNPIKKVNGTYVILGSGIYNISYIKS